MASMFLPVRRIALALAFALALAGCGGGDGASLAASPETPVTSSPPPELKSLFGLAPAPVPAQPPQPPAPGDTVVEGLLDASSQTGGMDFRYDAYVVTALRTGTVGVTSIVVEGRYPFGYGFPISVGLIANGADLLASGMNYEKDALTTGVAVTRYAIEKDQQYILVYKTFGNFTPLRYLLYVGDGLRVEGRIAAQGKGELPTDPGGLISLQNPRPRALSGLMDQIAPVLR